MRRAILLTGPVLAILTATVLLQPGADVAGAQSGQDRLVVFETFQRSN